MKDAKRHVAVVLVLMSAALLLSSCARNPQKARARYLASGQDYMKKGQFASAAIQFRNALKVDPRFVDGYYQLAQAYLAQQDWNGAYTSLAKAIELDPNRMDARLERGRLYLAARQYDKAGEEANFILKQDPKNVGAYQLLGATLVGEQKLEQASAAFLKVTELLPNDSSGYVNLALLEIGLHRPADAERHFKKAVEIDPKSVQACLSLANYYHLLGNLPEAEKVLQTGIRNNPNVPSLYINWANMLASAGNAAGADGVLERLRTQMPKSAEAVISIGDYYVQRHDTDKALAEYQRGLSVSVNNLDIEKRMEDLYLDLNQLEQATQIDDHLRKQAPKDETVRVNHGRVLKAQGKLQDAVSQLQMVAKDAPGSLQAHYYLGLSYWQNGSLGQANGELLDALRLSEASAASPGVSLVLRSLAQLSIAQGHDSEAQTYGQELVQRFPADVSNRLLLGGVYMRQGQARPAEEQFLEAKRLAPYQAVVHVALGQLYSAERKWTEAEKEFGTAIQLDPLSASILSQYADFLVGRQQLAKATERVRQFVNTNPANAQGHMILGGLEFQAKNYGVAQSEFARAIQLDPKDAQAYLHMGQVYQARNETEAAIGQYQRALELQPKFAPLCAMIGNLYLDRDDLETARKYYQKALEIDPNLAVALGNMAWVDALEGKDLDVALGLAQKALSLAQASPLRQEMLPSFTDTLAWVMYKKGNYLGAVPYLEDCISKAPNSAVYHYHLGMALVAAGQKEKGRAQLQASLQMKQPLRNADAEQARNTLTQTH
jgi:tetratricopeptide (TPR) repeat protein